MKTAISLPDTLFLAADELAAKLGVSRSELFWRAMEQLLREHEDADTTELLNAVYGSEAAVVPPTLARMQAASLPEDVW